MYGTCFIFYITKKNQVFGAGMMFDNKKIPKSGVDQQDIHTKIKLL